MQTVEVKGDRDRLTFDQRQTLDNKVIPTAQRWIKLYGPHTSMYQHARQTLTYWGEA